MQCGGLRAAGCRWRMKERKLRFAIFGNIYQERKSAAVQKLLAVLSAHEADLVIDKSFHAFLQDVMQIAVPACEVLEGGWFEADVAICMGGDGTFLNVAARVGSKQIPILGINTGRLGFLASFSAEDIEEAVERIYEGTYDVEHRSVLQLECSDDVVKGYPFALNEIAVLKHDSSSMISIHTSIDGEYLTTYQADGLIVGTPTGSTAYSLSVGGPIIVPQGQTISLTPVAPHSLNMRPIVLNDSSELELKVESRSHNFLVAIDGRSFSCPETARLRIRKAGYQVAVVTRQDQTFFSTLRRKMMWGADQRQ